MNTQELIQSATNAGLRLRLTGDYGLNVDGPPEAIAEWLPVLKVNKPKIMAALLPMSADLEMRMHAMFGRWKYSHSDATEFLALAHISPAEWLVNVTSDEIFHAKLLAKNWPLPQ